MYLLHYFECFVLLCAFGTSFEKSLSERVSFRNVFIEGLSVYKHKFNLTIENSNSLKEFLPDELFDTIKIVDQHIPVLYKNAISDIDSLDELIMENDEIKTIQPGAFNNLPFIRVINLKGNKLTRIDKDVFNNLGVSSIDLSYNQISYIHNDAFNNMPDLLSIRISENELKEWNKNWFFNTPSLNRVSMQNNSIEEFGPHAFKNFGGERLLGKTKLTVNLVFSHNKITKIDKSAFSDLQEINNLWLDHNAIEEIPQSVFKNLHIKNLKLDSNSLKCVSEEYLSAINADNINLDSNAWDCKCVNQIQSWSTKNHKEIETTLSRMTCLSENMNKQIDEIEQLLKNINKYNTKLETFDEVDVKEK